MKFDQPKIPWSKVLHLLQQYMQMDNPYDPGCYHASRIKQWLGYLRKEYQEANDLFVQVRSVTQADQILCLIQSFPITK